MSKLCEVIKATLFASGDAVEKDFMIEKLEVGKKEFEAALEELRASLGEGSGIELLEFKGKLQFASNSEYADEVAAVLNPIREKALTRAALETLAIIAYKQPITRLEIEDIRRTGSDYAVSILLEHKLIDVVGRKDAVGKPLLYGTTDEFLKRFGLSEVEELPAYEELLERIAVIRQEDNSGAGLYYEYDVEDTADVRQEDLDAIADRIKLEGE